MLVLVLDCFVDIVLLVEAWGGGLVYELIMHLNLLHFGKSLSYWNLSVEIDFL